MLTVAFQKVHLLHLITLNAARDVVTNVTEKKKLKSKINFV